jgi:LL-diaminopimelate aminotransferase
VALSGPGYPATRPERFAGETLSYALKETGFLPELQHPEDNLKKARILFLNYPNNLTAATAGLD